MGRDEEFLKRLLATFRVEAAEHVAAVSSGLLELEKTRAPSRRAELIEAGFREVHSLKGAARTVNVTEVESLCRSLENIFSALKRRDVQLEPDFFNLLHRTLDRIRSLLPGAETEGKEVDGPALKRLVSELDQAAREMEGKPVATAPEQTPGPVRAEPAPSAAQSAAETIRVEKLKLDSVLLQAEGLLRAKQSLAESVSDLQGILALAGALEKRWGVGRDSLRRFVRLLKNAPRNTEGPGFARLIDFLETGRDQVRSLQGKIAALQKKVGNDHHSVGAMVDSLLDDAKRVLMTPFSTLFEVLPRTVRDLLGGQGKEAALVITGGEVEVDRRILEEMKDPLIHLVRNCVDHGIEPPRVRTLKGKPAAGKISIAVSHRDSGKIELDVSDDGAGIDLAGVKSSALKMGVLSSEDSERLDEERLRELVFRSGVSTSPLITDLSGRGLGLAIVQDKVERLGGSVMCESSAETGTLFRLLLPLSLTTIRGLLVRVGERLLVLPEPQVNRILRSPAEQVRKIKGRETLPLDGGFVPLVPLDRILGLPPKGGSEVKQDFVLAVVFESGDTLIGFGVDEVIREQEFLFKPLGNQLKRVRNVSGATVLPGGSVAPVLNVSDLMKSAVKLGEAAPAAASPSANPPAARKSVLVVEDSVTARILLKNILEGAGYDAKTAVDGTDAYALLKSEPFDLVVSDVDMPRMNGFMLTTKIRSDQTLSELPVVLVTALDSRTDRERGIEVGANAYIVKSSFDQSNLLEVIRRLI